MKKKTEKILTYRTIIEPDEKGTYHGFIPALRGCHTWGHSIEETQKHLKEAVEIYIRNLVEEGEMIPQEQGMELIQTFSVPFPVYA